MMLDSILGGAPLWLWGVFHLLVFALLAADYFWTRGSLADEVIHRRSYWLTGLWVGAALGFALLVWRVLSPQYGLEYLTGYGIEEALSIDNLFVFLVLFRAFSLDAVEQRRVLFFGIAGAILLRALMIFVGIRLLDAFWWTNYLFGAILLYTAWHLLWEAWGEEGEEPPAAVRWLMRRLRVAAGPEHGHRFLVRERGRLRITSLFVALVAVELTDAIFATDSVPAVLAVSHHPFVVYASNIFAVLGLRSLYFTLAAMLVRLHKLQYGLAGILVFVGAKMMLSRVVQLPVWVSLAVLSVLLAATAGWSLASKPATLKTR